MRLARAARDDEQRAEGEERLSDAHGPGHGHEACVPGRHGARKGVAGGSTQRAFKAGRPRGVHGQSRVLAQQRHMGPWRIVTSDGPALAYSPPCSQGPGAKTYTFTLHALSAVPAISLPDNQVTGKVITDTISGITLAESALSVSYTRP